MKEQTKIIDDKAHLPAIYVEHLGGGENMIICDKFSLKEN